MKALVDRLRGTPLLITVECYDVSGTAGRINQNNKGSDRYGHSLLGLVQDLRKGK